MRWSPDKRTIRTVSRFAWWPVTDPASGITVWLERVQLRQEKSYCEWDTTEVNILHRPSRAKALLTQQKNYLLLWYASAFFWLWTLADELISRRMPPGYIEANPYARDLFGRFVWSHAFVHDLCYFIAYAASGCMVARLLSPPGRYKPGTMIKLDNAWAQLPGALWLIYFGLEHMEGFLGNVWAHLGWLVNDAMIFGR